MAKMPLYGKHGVGLFAIVDDSDFIRLSQWRWSLRSNGYVYRPGGVALHNEVMGITNPDRANPIDHENRNKLDNRRVNLKKKSKSQDLLNRPIYRNCPFGVRYVYPRPRVSGMRYVVSVNGKWIGTFTSLDEAKLAAMPFQKDR